MRGMILVLACAGLVCGCENEKKSDLGTATANAAADTAVLKEAQAAANEVLRNGADCDAAKPALAEANRKLAEAAGKVRTPAGQQTLSALRAQVRAVEQACP